MGARQTKALAKNKKGISKRHRDHRTHRIQNLPKKKHDYMVKQEDLARLDKIERQDRTEDLNNL